VTARHFWLIRIQCCAARDGARRTARSFVVKGDKVFRFADRVAQSLAHPERYPWGHHPDVMKMRDILSQSGVSIPLEGYWREIVHYSRPALAALNRAVKFKLTQEFVDIIDRWSELRPPAIDQVLMTARLPAVPTWLEICFENHEAAHIGALVTYYRDDRRQRFTQLGMHRSSGLAVGDAIWYEIQMYYADDGGPHIYPLPMALLFRPNGNVDDALFNKGADKTGLSYDEVREAHRNVLLGREYCKRWRKFKPLLLDIAAHGMWIETYPGAFPVAFFKVGGEQHGYGDEFEKRRIDHLSASMDESGALFRKMLATLALISTHIGGGTNIRSNRETSPRQFIKGKFLPTYEYKVLSLTRPMTAPTLLRRTVLTQARSIDGVRWHEVQGAWHHRRAITAVCQMHPRACPQAIWTPMFDDDGNKLGADQQRCELCDRKRWRIEQHSRGDKSLGVVEKDYEVRAPRRPVKPPREAA